MRLRPTPLLAALALLAAAPSAAVSAPAATTPKAEAQPMQAEWHGTSWSVPITLSGRAMKAAKVSVSAPCAIGTCSASTKADAKGKWKVRLDAIVGPGAATLAVKLESGAQSLTRTFTVAEPIAAAPGSGTVMVIGDSLAVGTAAVLPELLPGRRVTTQAAVGRFLAQGTAIFGHTPIDKRIGVAVFSLFTNDDPRRVDALRTQVRATMTRLGAKRCAVWFTIRRPAVAKVSYKAANAALLELAADPAYAGRLIVVPWSEAVDENKALLGKDRVHPTPAGYRQRAQLTADAIGRCPVSPAG